MTLFDNPTLQVRPSNCAFILLHVTHRSVGVINTDPATHHDALEFPDGQIVLLHFLEEGQQSTVLQLPVTHEGARTPEPEKTRVS